MNHNLQIPTHAIAEFCRRWHIRELSLFGSATRNDFGPQSDIDILIELESDSKTTLLEFIDMRDELQHIFGRTIDLVTPQVLRNPYRRQAILRDKEAIYVSR